MMAVDEYVQNVIKAGDEISDLLEKAFASTLKNSGHVSIISQGTNGIKVIRLPKDKLVVVHSTSGNSEEMNSKNYAHSVVDNLMKGAEKVGSMPIGFANVIDASTSNKETIMPFAEALAERANFYGLIVPNGEFAVLGKRVTAPANISATMISFVPKDSFSLETPGFFEKDGVMYAVFDPQGQAVYMNSDGVGTKTEFYERSGQYDNAHLDSLAMKLDDLVKIGATARVVSDVAETNVTRKEADRIGKLHGGYKRKLGTSNTNNLIYIIQHEQASNRIRGYKDGAFVFNVSGSAISTIDEERLNNPLKPKEGDYLIAIRGYPNPRSNGITDKRETMVKLFGQKWHNTQAGKIFIEFLGTPSTIFYPVFKSLIDGGLASSVYHMSGGAFNGKLAKPLAKHGLYVEIKKLFPADWRELTLSGAKFSTAEIAYAKWPMGNEGFISTVKPEEAIQMLKEYGLEGRNVGRIERREGMTGVRLLEINNSNGESVYYSGS